MSVAVGACGASMRLSRAQPGIEDALRFSNGIDINMDRRGPWRTNWMCCGLLLENEYSAGLVLEILAMRPALPVAKNNKTPATSLHNFKTTSTVYLLKSE